MLDHNRAGVRHDTHGFRAFTTAVQGSERADSLAGTTTAIDNLTTTLPLIRQLSSNASQINSWQAGLNPPPTHSHSLSTREFNQVKH